ILVESLVTITKSNEARKKKAQDGLRKLLGRDSEEAKADLDEAHAKLAKQKSRDAKKMGLSDDEESMSEAPTDEVDVISSEELVKSTQKTTAKKAGAGTKKAAGKKK